MNEAPGSRRFMKGLSLNSPYYDLGDCTATSFFHIIRSKFNKLFLKGSVLSGGLFFFFNTLAVTSYKLHFGILVMSTTSGKDIVFRNQGEGEVILKFNFKLFIIYNIYIIYNK